MGALVTFWRLATSRPGLMVIAAALGWWWGHGSASDACDADKLRIEIAALEQRMAEEAAAREESERRVRVIATQRDAARAEAESIAEASTLALAQLMENDDASRAGDDRLCLDPDGVGRVRDLTPAPAARPPTGDRAGGR